MYCIFENSCHVMTQFTTIFPSTIWKREEQILGTFNLNLTYSADFVYWIFIHSLNGRNMYTCLKCILSFFQFLVKAHHFVTQNIYFVIVDHDYAATAVCLINQIPCGTSPRPRWGPPWSSCRTQAQCQASSHALNRNICIFRNFR